MHIGSVQDRFKGTLLGVACGDALGMPVEGWLYDRIRLFYGRVGGMMDGRLPAGSWTDDTQMTMAVAESLIEEGGVKKESLIRHFLENYESKRGYGYGTKMVLSSLRRGMKLEDVASSLFVGGSFGNGAAMRIAPVALFYFDEYKRLREASFTTSSITHTHPLGMEGAALLAFAIAEALKSEPQQIQPLSFIQHLLGLCKEEAIWERLSLARELLQKDAKEEEVIEKLGCGVFAQDSVPTAIFCFLKFAHNLKEAILYAVNLGGDADTIASMCGALCGALHGAEVIPEEWLRKLERKRYIEDVAERLFNAKFKG
jgi:poly(ADP-ribose) glycohydrolase ARH3